MFDQETTAMLERAAQDGVPPRHSMSVSGARELLIDDNERAPPPVRAVRTLSMPGPGGDLSLRVYRPVGEHRPPVLVYFHGGGWVRGSLDSTDRFCRTLTDRAGCLVVSVGYRLAPEDPFPAAVEDAYTATAWVANHAEHLGGDPSYLGVGGHSAGGNLAAVVSILAVRRSTPRLSLQVLLNPVTDFVFDTNSYATYDLDFWTEHCPRGAAGVPLSLEDMEWYRDHYLRSALDRVHPCASPLRERSLAGVAPAVVVTSEFDPLRDEGDAYADRLCEAGVPVDHVTYSSSLHSFIVNPDDLDRADEELEALAATIEAGLMGTDR